MICPIDGYDCTEAICPLCGLVLSSMPSDPTDLHGNQSQPPPEGPKKKKGKT